MKRRTASPFDSLLKTISMVSLQIVHLQFVCHCPNYRASAAALALCSQEELCCWFIVPMPTMPRKRPCVVYKRKSQTKKTTRPPRRKQQTKDDGASSAAATFAQEMTIASAHCCTCRSVHAHCKLDKCGQNEGLTFEQIENAKNKASRVGR
ncbi:hypothetical protein M514_01567 [Trichuris suis]|uniref:Uncharacterized protein n=1 Tax=Trichuris suis TaxID=68888 RepID=A0A085MJR8_9BILA|nr:hypothetical protein M513_01567 [Trichuris suis]KFD66570.1 hypothetical protein M514_01567 [Trichuris suis]